MSVARIIRHGLPMDIRVNGDKVGISVTGIRADIRVELSALDSKLTTVRVFSYVEGSL